MNRRQVVACLAGLTSEIFWSTSPAGTTSEVPRNVSLIRLIANPNTFDGRHLRLAGYLGYNGIDRAVGLYVSETDGRNSILSNSIDLNLEESTAKKLLGRYVILEGVYEAPRGPGSEYLNGSVDHISSIKAWQFGDSKQG